MSLKRAVFVANDGLGAGHVTRALAVAQTLAAQMARRGQPFAWMLATTSEADTLIQATGAMSLRLPSARTTQRQGMPLSAYRRLQQETLRGLFDGFPPDLLVVDTFPAGPHLELSALIERAPRRVLIQRAVASGVTGSAEMTTARGLYHATLCPADPLPLASPWRGTHSIPPITLAWPRRSRLDARQALGLGADERVALLNPGGGGDADAIEQLSLAAPHLARRGYRVVLAAGPLAHGLPAAHRICPLAPYLLAFDVAIAAAGYNSAHELAEAGVPAALFARPRPFDDQQGRAQRFEKAGLAVALPSLDPGSLDAALDRMETMTPPRLSTGGAEAAAAVLAPMLCGEA